MKKSFINPSILAIILAGGKGERTWPLVKFRSKPAIPWGGNFRLIDIPVSNIFHSGIRNAYVMVQSQPHSLAQHIDRLRPTVISQVEEEFITLLPPHLGKERFFVSDADSLLHWQTAITTSYDIVVVVMADQIMKIDFRPIINMFADDNIDAVMLYSQVKTQTAENQLGVLKVKDGLIKDMEEKPAKIKWVVPNKPDECYANIAAYVIRRATLAEMLTMIGNEFEPHISLSKSGIPWMIHNKRVAGYNLKKNTSTGASGLELGYFEDAGTLDSYFISQMTSCSTTPPFDIFSQKWPLLTAPPKKGWRPPSKTGRSKINGAIQGLGSIIQDDCDISMSVISAGAIVGNHSIINDSIILDGAKIGPNCHLNKVVIEKDAQIPAGSILSPENSPLPPLRFVDVYELIKQQQLGEKVDIPADNPILSDGGVLFFPKFFKF